MKSILFFLSMVSLVNVASATSQAPTQTEEKEPCILQAEISDPKDMSSFPLQLCMYKHTESPGIFSATACVIVLVETQSGTRHPFYGSKGHWGIEGGCDRDRVTSKFEAKDTLSTVNPISDLKSKRQHGFQVKILKDDLKVGDTLLSVSKPTPAKNSKTTSTKNLQTK